MALKQFVVACLFAGHSLSATAAPLPSAEPFGLRDGIRQSDFRKLAPDARCDDEFSCSFDVAPKPLTGASFYGSMFGPKAGLCKVWAAVIVERPSVYGDQVQSQFDRLREAVTQKYGQPSSTHDFLRAGSIWKEPRDWMTALAKKERVLASYWVRDDAEAPAELPRNLESITVYAHSSSQSMAAVVLSYEFSNIKDCMAEQQSRSLDAL